MNQPKSLTPTELKRLHREWRRSSDARISLILDGVQKPYNIGSIARSAAAYKAEHVWLVPPSPKMSDQKVAKTALGCDRLVNWTQVETSDEAVSAAKEAGFATVAVELATNARPIFELDLQRPICLVVGHEERGVAKSTLALVDDVAFIPQLGKVGSLNVAHAASIALYEALRQNARP